MNMEMINTVKTNEGDMVFYFNTEDLKLLSSVKNLVLLPSGNETESVEKQLELFELQDVPEACVKNILAIESYKYIESQIEEVLEHTSTYLTKQAYNRLYIIMDFYMSGNELPTVLEAANELLSYF